MIISPGWIFDIDDSWGVQWELSRGDCWWGVGYVVEYGEVGRV
jgi:hypothetical protein